MLHSAIKSQLPDILEQGTNTKCKQPNADTVIMDNATLINIRFDKKVQSSIMPDGYATEGLYLILSSMLENTPDMMLYLVYITKTV